MSTRICLGKKLRYSSSVKCIDLKYDWDAYSEAEKSMLINAEKIYFPTIHYYSLFSSLGKDIFPSRTCYELIGNKIRQSLLLKSLKVPHPKTKIFTGKNLVEKILSSFHLPFVAKIPLESSRGLGVFLINDLKELKNYLLKTKVAYIQEYVPTDRDLRVVLMGREIILAYWRIGRDDDFRNNVARGAYISFDNIPNFALDLCLKVAETTKIDHAGFDLIISEEGPKIIEINIHFGREGFREKGLSYTRLLAFLADHGKI